MMLRPPRQDLYLYHNVMQFQKFKWEEYTSCDDTVYITGMNLSLQIIQSTALANQFKPAILQCFGDIAGAIGGHFETYLSVGK
jgi:hypothetical protein